MEGVFFRLWTINSSPPGIVFASPFFGSAIELDLYVQVPGSSLTFRVFCFAFSCMFFSTKYDFFFVLSVLAFFGTVILKPIRGAGALKHTRFFINYLSSVRQGRRSSPACRLSICFACCLHGFYFFFSGDGSLSSPPPPGILARR